MFFDADDDDGWVMMVMLMIMSVVVFCKCTKLLHLHILKIQQVPNNVHPLNPVVLCVGRVSEYIIIEKCRKREGWYR